jgi:hypothetical protein
MTNDRKSESARYGHVKRQLKQNKPLTGDLLDLALNLVGADNYMLNAEGRYSRRDARPLNKNDEPHISMIGKLKAGQPLDEYELHLMIDVFLLHAKLAGPAISRNNPV